MTLGPVQSTTAYAAPRDLGDVDDLTLDISEMDTNGDGTVGDDEFAAYRSQKQARGEFIPMDGPVSDAMQQAIFESFLAQETLDQDV